MENAIKYTEVKTYFTLLEEQLQGRFEQVYGEQIMNINNLIAKGTVKAVEVRKNKFYFEFDLEVKREFSLEIPPKGYNAINFLYCENGQIDHAFGESNVYNTINEFQTAIVAHKTQKTVLRFRANSKTNFIIISVCNQGDTKPSPMIATIHSLFTNKMENNKFAYFGSINLKISEQISALKNITETGIVRKLLLDGTVQLILGMEIKHHKEDLANRTVHSSSLTRRELVIIKKIGERIKNNVADQYSIEILMDETGISASKLQEGFKLLYNRTVTDYIKNLRVEESERLICETDLNVSQIVYTIGFSSRSYFSKIFRQKYRCSPNEYLNKRRVAVSA